jgi:tripartite-type tricarboxylate transporter receptor subunit TctC
MKLKTFAGRAIHFVSAWAITIAAAHAQDVYPSKPVHVMVPFPSASATDVLARTIGQKLSEKWGQPVIVENKPGAGGNLGSEVAAKAPADGYTLLMGTVANTISASLYKKLNYDFVKDFTPVTFVATTPLVLSANAKFLPNTVKELVDYAKTKPGQVNFASGGTGTSNHLAGEMLKSMTGIDIVHVPYKGTPAAHSDLLAGQVQLMFDNILAVMPHIKAGRLKPIAVTSARRVASLPDVPTVAEAGVPGFEAVSWVGVLVPAGTPTEIVSKLNADIGAVLAMPDVKARLAAGGAEVESSTPEEFAAHIQKELMKWAKAVKDSGARVD